MTASDAADFSKGCGVPRGGVLPVTRELSRTYWDWHQHPAMRVPINYGPSNGT